MIMNKTVIFDMDGVIFDTENAQLACWLEAAKAYPVTEELVAGTFVKCTGTNHDQTVDIFNNAFSPVLSDEERWDLWNAAYGIYRERYAVHPVPTKPGVVELLEYLKEQGIRIGLASSSDKDMVENQLETAGLIDYFESITGGDAVKISKPNPEIYLIACDKMGVAPEDCYAIEDSFNGVRAAYAAGMTPVMVPDLKQPNDEIRQMAEIVCKDLFEVVDYFKGIFRK